MVGQYTRAKVEKIIMVAVQLQHVYSDSLHSHLHKAIMPIHVHVHGGYEQMEVCHHTTNQGCVDAQVESAETHRSTPDNCNRQSNPQRNLD